MPSYELVIEPKTPAAPGKSRRAQAEPKTRQFHAQLLAYVTANAWWEGGQANTDNVRPVWLMLAATERAARPFVSNLQAGYRATIQPCRDALTWGGSPEGYLELLKSAGYRYITLKLKGMASDTVSVMTAYLPELVTLDPGMIDRVGVAFLALTSRRWIAAMLNPEAAPAGGELLAAWSRPDDQPAPPSPVIQAATDAGPAAWMAMSQEARRLYWRKVAAHLRALGRIGPVPAGRGPTFAEPDLLALLPQAVHVVSYLDHHTASPIRATLSFMLQVFLAGLQEGILTLAYPVPAGRRAPTQPAAGEAGDPWAWARHDPGFVAYNTDAVGLAPPIACRCPHTQVDDFLQQQLDLYFAKQATLGPLAEEQDLPRQPAAARRHQVA
ncbi:MAG TPA: hypothetical protein VKY74_26320 [Chloroflexia bacterium]|nr:hypothetical protein [Chloroflexia bacterium]